MAIPDFQTLMLPVLEAAARGETSAKLLAEAIARQFALTEAECEELLPSGRQKVLHNRIHWAKFNLSKAGLVATPHRGRFLATPAGKALLKTRPARIDMKLLMQYPEYRKHRAGQTIDGPSQDDLPELPVAPDSPLTPDEQIEAAAKAHRAAIRADLLDRMTAKSEARISPSCFEQLILDLLLAMGYGGSHEEARQQLGGTGDGGVDGVINEDRLGLDRIYVQAKRYASSNTVSSDAVRSFIGSLSVFGANRGVFVTTSSFSQQARDQARANLAHRVILIDGETLADLMIEHGVGVRTSRTITLHSIDDDFFSDPE